MSNWLRIEDQSAVGAARRAAKRIGADLQLSVDKIELAAIVATEIASNILRHARLGRMLIQPVEVFGSSYLAVIGVDEGPGIENLERMMRDGESSIGSSGGGLGAMKRLSDRFDIHTASGVGTVVACEFWPTQARGSIPGHHGCYEVAGLAVNHPNENVCGDGYMVKARDDVVELLLCDGLGHGPKAKLAADETLASFSRTFKSDPAQVLAIVSHDIVGTRGSVAAMVRLFSDSNTHQFAGVGNISTMLVGGERNKRFAVRDGRLGGGAVHPHKEDFELEPHDVLVMHSDGLATMRKFDAPPGLWRRTPLTIAAYLINTYFRGRDDASILVARHTGEKTDARSSDHPTN